MTMKIITIEGVHLDSKLGRELARRDLSPLFDRVFGSQVRAMLSHTVHGVVGSGIDATHDESVREVLRRLSRSEDRS